MLRHWHRSSPPSPARSFVPRVERLEGRDVPSVTVLASGLEGAQGSAVGPGGHVYVTEGVAGRLSRIDVRTGAVTTVATGLPTGIFAGLGGGAIDVAFHDGVPYVLVTAVAEDLGGTDVVGIYRVDGPSSFTVVADLGAWSEAHPPATDIFIPTGNQYAIDPFRGGFLVTDGHHNRVLDVRLDGTITEVATFADVVPTGLAVHGNTVYVALAGPVPHLPEDGKVMSFRWNRPGVTQVVAGAPLVTDVEFGRANTLYALSNGVWEGVFDGDPATPNTGAFLRVNTNGTFTVLEDEIDRPTSLEFVGTTAYIVTLGGQVLRIDGGASLRVGSRPGGSGRSGKPPVASGGDAAWWGIYLVKAVAPSSAPAAPEQQDRRDAGAEPSRGGDVAPRVSDVVRVVGPAATKAKDDLFAMLGLQ